MICDLVDRCEPDPEGASGRVVVCLVPTGDLPERVKVATAPPVVDLPGALAQLLTTTVGELRRVPDRSSSSEAAKRIASASASLAFCVNSWSSVPPPPRSLRMFARLPRWSDDRDSVCGSSACLMPAPNRSNPETNCGESAGQRLIGRDSTSTRTVSPRLVLRWCHVGIGSRGYA